MFNISRPYLSGMDFIQFPRSLTKFFACKGIPLVAAIAGSLKLF